MRGIRVRFEITPQAINKGHRYDISTTNGSNPHGWTLADPKDKYSTNFAWRSLLGEPETSIVSSSNTQTLSVQICRQIPNPHFDPMDPQSFIQHKDFQFLSDVSSFRLYNPLFARPYLQWNQGGSIPFSEGDEKHFAYEVEKIWNERYDYVIPEKDIQWSVHRLDDSSDFKEFLIKLD